MPVFRVERTGNYTVMSNCHLRDKALSLKAKGLLSQMLSLPEDWDYTLAGLARINREGQDAVRAAVVELERAGYVTRARVRDEKGRLLGTEYVIRERPFFSAAPAQEAPAPENPAQEKPAQLKKEPNKKKELRSTDPIPLPSAPPAAVSGAAEPPEAKGRKRQRSAAPSGQEMADYRALIRENIGYERLVRDRPYDAGQLNEMVELMVEAVCSRRETLRVAGNDLPQAAVKSRLLKLEEDHIRFVFDCLRENTTRVRSVKQYLLAVLYNAPVTMESHYAARVSHDLYGEGASSGPGGFR